MNGFPKISIVTPSFNQGEFLEKTILSVLDQNYPNLEYIIIDGGSTDNSIDIIKKYQHRLTYWKSEKDNGQYDAINKGFKYATGEIFGFLNSDDIYYPWTLATLVSLFESQKSVDWVTSLSVTQLNAAGVVFAKGTLAPISSKAFLDGLYIPGKFGFGVISQEGTFWRSSLWYKAGGINLNYKLAGDFDLWCNFMKYSLPYSLELPLAAMTRHQDQRSNQHVQYINECEIALTELNFSFNRKKRFKDTFRISLLKILPNNRIFWSVFKYVYSYKCKVINPFFNDESFELKWIVSDMLIYNRK